MTAGRYSWVGILVLALVLTLVAVPTSYTLAKPASIVTNPPHRALDVIADQWGGTSASDARPRIRFEIGTSGEVARALATASHDYCFVVGGTVYRDIKYSQIAYNSDNSPRYVFTGYRWYYGTSNNDKSRCSPAKPASCQSDGWCPTTLIYEPRQGGRLSDAAPLTCCAWYRTGNGTTLPHRAGYAMVRLAGINVQGTNSVSADPTRTDGTSFEGIRLNTVAGIIRFKRQSNLSITITGAAEDGHKGGLDDAARTYSHDSGWKVDIDDNPTVDSYILNNYCTNGTPIKYTQYGTNFPGCGVNTPSGEIFFDERGVTGAPHWDILYRY